MGNLACLHKLLDATIVFPANGTTGRYFAVKGTFPVENPKITPCISVTV